MDETRLIFPFSLKEREIEMKKRVYTLYRVSTKGQVEKDDIPMQKNILISKILVLAEIRKDW